MDLLQSEGFRPIGAWTAIVTRAHQNPTIRRQSGLYAFVVDGELHYVGQATSLHRRLRHYGNRCFRPAGALPLRPVHVGILDAVQHRRKVEVWCKLVPPEALTAEENRLLSHHSPSWNRTGTGR